MEHIQFIKVDGQADFETAERYEIESFPTFIILSPGSQGEKWDTWNPRHRDFAGMKRWIKKQIGDTFKTPAASPELALENLNLSAGLPIVAG